ncbi:MAG: TetR/AcrR family transcriptional regulator [Alphaproteobacteria bacterium]|nr:MAG: TetR/AcrR family transcriptional regulator [Alphaproteobacteria bacterium]
MRSGMKQWRRNWRAELEELICCSSSAAGRGPDPEKRQAILKAASELFLADGPDRTSMDRIARRAGVSKQTVYAHFNSKERLYRAVIAQRLAAYFPESPLDIAVGHDFKVTLQEIGERIMRLVFSPEAVGMVRRLIEAAPREPRLATLFFEEGVDRLEDALVQVFSRAIAAGHFPDADPQLAARRFDVLLLDQWYLRALLDQPVDLTGESISRHVARAVRDLLALARAGRLIAQDDEEESS